MLATMTFGVACRAGRRSWAMLQAVHARKATRRKNGATPGLVVFDTMSVGQDAQRGFQLGVDRTALAEDPGQAKEG